MDFNKYDNQQEVDSKKLFVSNMSYNVTDAQLRATFEQFGNVLDAIIIVDRNTNRSRGFGFVKFDNPVDAGKAKTEMDGKEFYGRTLRISFARPINRNNSNVNSRY